MSEIIQFASNLRKFSFGENIMKKQNKTTDVVSTTTNEDGSLFVTQITTLVTKIEYDEYSDVFAIENISEGGGIRELPYGVLFQAKNKPIGIGRAVWFKTQKEQNDAIGVYCMDGWKK